MVASPSAQGQNKPADLSSLTDSQVKELKADLSFLIDQIAKRIEYAEARRQTIAVLAGTLIAASIATLALTLTNVHQLSARVSLIVLSVVLIGVGLFTWTVYMRQTNYVYPFTQVTKTWKWFYRYALKDYKSFDAAWHAFQTKARFEAGTRTFEEQWESFRAQQVLGLVDPRTSASQDLEQVYLLHVNERYKNLFLTQLRKILARGVAGAVIIGLGAALVGGWLARRADGVGSATSIVGGKRIETYWRETGQVRSRSGTELETQLLVNMAIDDSTRPLGLGAKLIARDNLGFAIPISAESIQEVPRVPGSNRSEGVALVWLPASLRTRLSTFVVVP